MRTLRIASLPLVLAASVTAHAQDRPAHSYVLEATLDPESHTVTGTERILWTNESREPAHELFLHLYLNAFESPDTVFMRESGGALRGDRFEGEGSIELTSLALADGTDLLPFADDELMEGDRTQLRVPLAEAVAPGESVVVEAAFVSHLPPVFARSGYAGSFHMVAQWFPKMARREPDGTWATFPYHGYGEFYADFARYDLTVTAPAGFVVGATGELVDERRGDGTITRRFVADRVHDTAFCAWDHFVERRFESDGVEVRILHPPGYEQAVDTHEAITRHGLSHYGRLFGAYPYPVLTVIVPPRGASGAAGMEYPTLFVTAGSWFHVPGVHIGEVESTTAHELAHQWFQGMVATNEVEWPMLDEGLTQWSTGELLGHLYGRRRSAVDLGELELDFFQVMRTWALRGGPTPPPGSPVYGFEQDTAYGRAVYGRTSVVLETVRRVWGAPRFERAIGAYARAQRFRHPGPDALFDAFDRVYWPGFSDAVLAPALMEGAAADMELVSFHTRREGDAWLADVEAQRKGTLPIPTRVVLRREGGVVTSIDWPGDAERLTATHAGSERADVADLDPDAHVLLDADVLDDQKRLSGGDGEGWLARLLFVAQQVLSWVGP